MPEELGQIIENLINVESSVYGDIEIFSGLWLTEKNCKILVSVAWSGWGKVSAARATTRLISTCYLGEKVNFLIFTGLAGAVNKDLNQWDIVIADSVIQHDMDARPLYKKFVIPVINNQKIYPKIKIIDFLETKIKEKLLKNFGLFYKGLIGTGDMFISDENKLKELFNQIPELLAVEMEGAAFAQVAHQEKIDWILIRTISDGADDKASQDFSSFLSNYNYHSLSLIKAIIEILIEAPELKEYKFFY